MSQTILLALNLVAALVSSLAGVAALFLPQSLTRSFTGSEPVTHGEQFYANLYAARTVPFGITVGLLPYLYRGPVVLVVLCLAGAIQIGDIFIGIHVKSPRIITGAFLATVSHLACACVLAH